MNGITIDWSMIDWKWLVATELALYAAVLSTYREIQSRRQWRARLKVQLNLNVIAMMPQGPSPQMQIWVENHGRLRRPVQLAECVDRRQRFGNEAAAASSGKQRHVPAHVEARRVFLRDGGQVGAGGGPCQDGRPEPGQDSSSCARRYR
jgi:hypothetical protein